MPVHTTKRGTKFAVVDDQGKSHGTHPTKKAAQAQATAINIAQGHVPGVKPRKGRK